MTLLYTLLGLLLLALGIEYGKLRYRPQAIISFGPLSLDYVNGVDWYLTRRLSVMISDPMKVFDDEPLHIDPNFVTDFASVPKILRWLIPPIGKYSYAAVLHDYLYRNPHHILHENIFLYSGSREDMRHHTATRAEADKLFYDAMLSSGVNPVLAFFMYIGVRIGGWVTWNKVRDNLAKLCEGDHVERIDGHYHAKNARLVIDRVGVNGYIKFEDQPDWYLSSVYQHTQSHFSNV